MYKLAAVAILLVGTVAVASHSNPVGNRLASPVIVAKIALAHQTSAIPKSVIFTPSENGLYRISPYIAMTSPGSTGFWTFETYWTDDGGANVAELMNLDCTRVPAYGTSPSGDTLGSFTFRAVPGQPVSFDVTDGGTGAGGTYEVLFVIERIL